jgi:protein subunit release factor B
MNKFRAYKYFKLSQITTQPVPELKKLSEQEIANLKITTEPWKHGSGPGGQKVNTKASGGRARCVFQGKKYVAESKVGRDTVYNQGKAYKFLIEDLNIVLNKERTETILSNERLMQRELLALKGKEYEFPEEVYKL